MNWASCLSPRPEPSCSSKCSATLRTRSTMVTSNLPFQEWTEVLARSGLTGGPARSLTHHVHILEMNADTTPQAEPPQTDPILRTLNPTPPNAPRGRRASSAAPEALLPRISTTNQQLSNWPTFTTATVAWFYSALDTLLRNLLEGVFPWRL